MRPEEIEIDQRAKEVLSPTVPVEKQHVPSGLRHQIYKLAASFSVQHGRSVYKEVLQSRHSEVPDMHFVVAGLIVLAQWLNYPTAGIPRGADGKPNLNAPAPGTA